MNTFLQIVALVASSLMSTWLFSEFVLSWEPRARYAHWLCAEIRPFRFWIWGAQVAAVAIGNPAEFIHDPMLDVVLAVELACCFIVKKDDDDRWKKRRRKLASKVAEVAGRLQVIPAPAGT